MVKELTIFLEKEAVKCTRNKDFVGKIGSKGYVSALLNKRKPLHWNLQNGFMHN